MPAGKCAVESPGSRYDIHGASRTGCRIGSQLLADPTRRVRQLRAEQGQTLQGQAIGWPGYAQGAAYEALLVNDGRSDAAHTQADLLVIQRVAAGLGDLQFCHQTATVGNGQRCQGRQHQAFEDLVTGRR
ncbi:hypothetical protein D3C79_773210 [compost metagenome]